MDLKTLIITIVIIIIVITFTSKHNFKSKSENDSIMLELDHRVSRVLKECGYNINYNMKSHPTKTLTIDKSQVYICQSCIKNESNIVEMDKLVYVGLHEAAHVVTKTHNHSNEWDALFRTFLLKAADLGYLDKNRITIHDP